MAFDRESAGARMKKLRESKGWTQEYVAMKMNVCVDHYCRIELGKRTPSIDLLHELAHFLGSDLNYIVDGIEKDAVQLSERDFEEVIAMLRVMQKKV